MSTASRKRFESMMRETGIRSLAGPGFASDVMHEANAIGARLHSIAYDKQPMSIMAVLLALDAVRRTVLRTLDKSEISEDDRERFMESYQQFCDGVSREPITRRFAADVGLGTVEVTLTARLDQLKTNEEINELVRRQVAALRRFAAEAEAGEETPGQPQAEVPRA